MKSHLILLLLSLLLLTACGGNAHPEIYKDAIAYNDFIIGLEEQVGEALLNFGMAIPTENKEEMQKTYEEMVRITGEVDEEAQALNPFGDDTDFHAAAQELFAFYHRIAENEYKEYLDIYLKEQMEKKDLIRLEQVSTGVVQEEAQIKARFRSAQENFALANNFILRNSDNTTMEINE